MRYNSQQRFRLVHAMSTTSSLLTTIAHSFSTIILLCSEVVILVVILTTVRKNRPEATLVLTTGAALQVVATITQPVVYTVAGSAISTSGAGVDTLTSLYALVGVFYSVLRAIGFGAIAMGIVQLAKNDEKKDPTRYLFFFVEYFSDLVQQFVRIIRLIQRNPCDIRNRTVFFACVLNVNSVNLWPHLLDSMNQLSAVNQFECPRCNHQIYGTLVLFCNQ